MSIEQTEWPAESCLSSSPGSFLSLTASTGKYLSCDKSHITRGSKFVGENGTATFFIWEPKIELKHPGTTGWVITTGWYMTLLISFNLNFVCSHHCIMGGDFFSRINTWCSELIDWFGFWFKNDHYHHVSMWIKHSYDSVPLVIVREGKKKEKQTNIFLPYFNIMCRQCNWCVNNVWHVLALFIQCGLIRCINNHPSRTIFTTPVGKKSTLPTSVQLSVDSHLTEAQKGQK